MKVLKIDHARVIDTSLLFKYKYPGAKRQQPSLNNLCKFVLGYAVHEDCVPHNCVHDAAAAMKLVLAVVEKGVETSIPVTKEMLETDKSRLLLHRIPHNVPTEVISRNFTHEFKLLRRQGGCYQCAVVHFNSPAEANKAFENITRDLGKDSAGLPQKQVFPRPNSPSGPGLYFHVRKMVEDDYVEETSASKRCYPEEKKKVSSKKRKREHVDEETREADVGEEKTEEVGEDDMIKEIEGLKQKLKDKDKMIDYLKTQLRKKKKKTVSVMF